MTPVADVDLEQRIAAIRRFNRFYTRKIGVLREGFLGSQFSLAQVRVLYELAHQDTLTAAALSKELSLDPGYLSRILREFEARSLIRRTPSETDGREVLLRLTARGRQAFAPLNARQRDEIVALLRGLSPGQQDRLLQAMQVVEELLDFAPAVRSPCLLRSHQPGDIGWVVHRHGVLYVQEYGLDERFEALVAESVAGFIRRFDAGRERCWIAEQDGGNVGCVFLMKRSATVAVVRLLLVEPAARGAGLGARLLSEGVRVARLAGYGRVTLQAANEFRAARRVFQRVGFSVVREGPYHVPGRALHGETWELRL